jgi:hypothetical protein
MNSSRPLISIDLETGGFWPGWHPIVSISFVASGFGSEGEPLRCRDWFIDLTARDQLAINPQAREVNGYDYDVWMGLGAVPLGVALEEFRSELSALMEGRREALLVAHNAGFDRGFLQYEFDQCGMKPLDRYQWRCSQQLMAQVMDRGLIPQGSLGLAALGELCGVWPEGGRPKIHGSSLDARVALQGYEWLLDVQGRGFDNLLSTTV